MPSQDYDDILASVQQLVRQAYTLGRADALKQVVDVLKNDGTTPQPLALMAPEEPSKPAEVEKATAVAPAASNDDAEQDSTLVPAGPWWSREPKRMW